MATFESSKLVPVTVPDLTPVAQEVMNHFQGLQYEVSAQPKPGGGVLISLRKGSTFKKVLGLQTALNINLDPVSGGTEVKAGIGIFDQQLIPSMITLFVAWPMVIAQIWGIVQQSKLDDEAVAVAEAALQHVSGGAGAASGFASGPSAGYAFGPAGPPSGPAGGFGAGPISAGPAGPPGGGFASGPAGGVSAGPAAGYASGPAAAGFAVGPASGPTSVPSAGPEPILPESRLLGQAGGATPAAAPSCPTCGHALSPTAKFCPECGTKVGA